VEKRPKRGTASRGEPEAEGKRSLTKKIRESLKKEGEKTGRDILSRWKENFTERRKTVQRGKSTPGVSLGNQRRV